MKRVLLTRLPTKTATRMRYRSGSRSTVWKLGATWDFGGGFNAGAYYKGTDAEEAAYTFKGKDWSKDRLVAFVSYSF